MITIQDVNRFKDTVSALQRPVVSLYVDANPASPDFDPRAAALCAKETLRGLDVPSAAQRNLLGHIEGRIDPARTLALFASGDDVHALPLQVQLPVRDPCTGHVEARFGEPYLLPLDLAIDEFQHYGVVYIDRERWRFFDAFLGDFEEIVDAFRHLQPDVVLDEQQARQLHPAYTPTRSDGYRDSLDRTIDAWTHRFHKRAAHLLADQVTERGIGRIVLMGPPQQTREFEHALSRPLRDRIVATLPSLTCPDASPGEVRRRIDEAVHQIERSQEARFLDRLREEGVGGVSRCLTALQDGRVHILAVPWDVHHMVYRDEDTGYVAADADSARKRSTKSTPDVRMMDLRHVLLDLAGAYGATIEFVRGGNAERLMDEFEGMAALTRW